VVGRPLVAVFARSSPSWSGGARPGISTRRTRALRGAPVPPRCAALVRALRRDTPAAYAAAGVLGACRSSSTDARGARTHGPWCSPPAPLRASRRAAERTRRRAQFVAVWTSGRAAPAPARVADAVGLRLHFLPILLFMAVGAPEQSSRCVPGTAAAAAPPRAACPRPPGGSRPRDRVLRLAWAAARTASFNAMTRPASIINYYVPYERPPAGRCLLALAGVARASTAGLLRTCGAADGRPNLAMAAVALVAVTAAVHPRDRSARRGSVVAGPQTLGGSSFCGRLRSSSKRPNPRPCFWRRRRCSYRGCAARVSWTPAS
jgi:hypothetical protein